MIKPSQQAKWYIITSMSGNEENVYKNIEDKINAYQLGELVQEMRLLKSREITIEVFDPINNPPPNRMINSKTITWESLPGNRYKKTKIREINYFPGYIYIKMVMNQDAWYIIRNTFGVTGFVGSSGKGAQPIPLSDLEVERLFDPNNNKDIIIHKNTDVYVEHNIPNTKIEEKKVEFLSVHNDQENKPVVPDVSSPKPLENESEEQDEYVFKEIMEKITNDPQLIEDYLNTNENEIQTTTIDETLTNQEKTTLPEFVDINDYGYSNLASSQFQVGNSVIVQDNLIGEIIALDNKKQTAVVLVNILGKENKIEVSFDDMKKNI